LLDPFVRTNHCSRQGRVGLSKIRPRGADTGATPRPRFGLLIELRDPHEQFRGTTFEMETVLTSEMRNAQPKVFYGWWVALTAALGLFLNTATIVVFSFGFFAKAIGQEFHGGRAEISLAFTIHNLTAALFIPLAGRLVDRYGPRKVLLPFKAGFGFILISSRFLSEAYGNCTLLWSQVAPERCPTRM